MNKVITKSGQVIETNETYSALSNAMTNKRQIEITTNGYKMMLNGELIESILTDTPTHTDNNSLYKNAINKSVSNFPFQQTQEEMERMQMQLQPMKVEFDKKKAAMEEMKRKEDEVINAAYKAKYDPMFKAIQEQKEKEEREKMVNLHPISDTVITTPMIMPVITPIVSGTPQTIVTTQNIPKPKGRPKKVINKVITNVVNSAPVNKEEKNV